MSRPPQETQRLITLERKTSTAHRFTDRDRDGDGDGGGETDEKDTHIHGHTLQWDVEVTARLPDNDANRAFERSDLIDAVDAYDHTLVVNRNDPLMVESDLPDQEFVYTPGDPTLECLAYDLADRVVSDHSGVAAVRVTLNDGTGYAVRAEARGD